MPALFSQLFQLLSQALYLLLHVTGGGTFPPGRCPPPRAPMPGGDGPGQPGRRQKLIEHNLRLVAHIIKKYYASQNDQEDLISIGTIGLIKAIDTFDPAKGIRLSSYASRCIENEILMFFRSGRKSRPGRVPQRAHRHRQGGQRPDHFRHHGCGRHHRRKHRHQDEKREAVPLSPVIPHPPGAGGGVQALRLLGFAPQPQRVVAKRLGISRSYISRIEKKALEKLRQQFQQERLL